MGTFNIGPCECCGAESECAACEIDLPDSIVVALSGVVNSSPPATPGCCPEAQCCTGCDNLNTSYVLDRIESCASGCCCWEATFSPIRFCDPGGTDCDGVVHALVQLCVIDAGGGNVIVAVSFFLDLPSVVQFAWGFTSDPMPAAEVDCATAFVEAMEWADTDTQCNFNASTASVSF